MDHEGAALVEALVSAPVLAVILAGVLAINAMYSAKLEAKSRSRRIAWLQADSGECPERPCLGGGCEAIEAKIASSGLDDLSSSRSGGLSLGSFFRDLGAFLVGRVTRGNGFAEAPIPKLFGAGRTSQRGVTTLLCNTTGRRTESGSSIVEHACSAGLGTSEYAREVCR